MKDEEGNPLCPRCEEMADKVSFFRVSDEVKALWQFLWEIYILTHGWYRCGKCKIHLHHPTYEKLINEREDWIPD